MKLKFDSAQIYQSNAVSAIVDLFDGQPLTQGDFTIQLSATSTEGQASIFQNELGIGNNIVLTKESIHKNLVSVQERNDLDSISFEDFSNNGMNFSVEMETGTGKTYVYLKTIFELNQKYGFKKFIIVVPSVAIREGALKNLEVTKEHFLTLYNNVEFEFFVYDSKRPGKTAQFARSNQLQVMVINIDAFNKDANKFNQELDKTLSGYSPKEFVQATNPILIIDEPQSVDSTPKAQEAIQSLNPSCILRFSATHKNLYNLVYKLDPVRAYELRLVKQIVVASVIGANAQNDGYVKLLDVDNKKGIKARIRIQVQGKMGISEKDFWVTQNTDLFALSNERPVYQNGFEVLDISAEAGNEYIDFNVGRLFKGQERGGIKDDLMDIQIRNTIKKHLDKELQVRSQGIKVLSLFFIDKVSNYRSYDESGSAVKGKFATAFEQHYESLIKLPQYKELNKYEVSQIHNGYFSQDKKGVFKDTNGNTQADDDTYSLIMKDKERLLSIEEPLKFIFSHSALREGWDNPNVFQICTLNETRSASKKRQELGRGLRLPVNQNGDRVFDDSINKLTIIANESYDEFAKKLQNEYEEDCGVTFGKVPKVAFKGIVSIVGDNEILIDRKQSEVIWEKLVSKNFLDKTGKILPSFTPSKQDFSLELPDSLAPIEAEIIAVLQSYQLDRHIKKEEDPKRLKLNKQVFLQPEFEQLWNKIKHRTTYQVEYKTDTLVSNCVESIKSMPKIDPVIINYREAQLGVKVKGVTTTETRANTHNLEYLGGLPDVIAYLQKQTELTRKTLVDVLVKSERLKDFAVNPQRFMDEVAAIINRELHKLMINGIKYEKLTVGQTEWSMQLLREDELKDYFEQCIEVNKSVFDKVIYESEVEKRFAEELDKRTDVKLFVKLPKWFRVETPVGDYIPDWAIVKHEDETIYLVRETKSTKNFEKLRNSEADKVKCGRKHFESINVDFNVVTSASEI